MALTLNTSLSGTINASDLNDNFSDISNKFSANILDADISSSANITTSKLAADLVDIWVHLKYNYDATTGAFSAGSDGDVFAVVPIPTQSSDDAFVLADATWFTNDTGSASATFNVELGYYDSSSNFQSVSELIAEESLTKPVSAGTVAQGRCTIDSSSIANASQAYVLALTRGATSGTNVVNGAGDYLIVSLRLTRALQAS